MNRCNKMSLTDVCNLRVNEFLVNSNDYSSQTENKHPSTEQVINLLASQDETSQDPRHLTFVALVS